MRTAELIPRLPERASILFVRLRSLGDTVLSTPLFAALKAYRSDLRLSVLVERPNHEVLLRNSDLESLFVLPPNVGGGGARFREQAKIRAQRFECCVNLHGGTTAAWFTRFSAARYRVGLTRFRNRLCYNVLVDLPTLPANTKQHTVEYQMSWLRALGLPTEEIPSLRIFHDPDLEPKVRDTLQQNELQPGAPYVVIQPTSRFFTKEWTATGFAAVADYIESRLGFRVVLAGAPGERRKLEDVAVNCSSQPVILETTSISELICVLRHARLFVGNDSGPTHIAAALGIPVVVLFGSSDSRVWYPWKATHEIVQNSFDCNPCPGYRCAVYGEPRCILSISVDQVTHAIERVLSHVAPTLRVVDG
jgi:predicted lipopolysaccharide heptosyltransferase III